MKILVLSDLHNEFAPFPTPKHVVDLVDLVVLAGDIDLQTRGVLWANETFTCPVIYCCGNHELYRGHLDRTLSKMKAAAAHHVHVLENESWTHGNVRFLVGTGWTDFSATGDVVAASMTCASVMNDFKMIRADTNYRRLRPADLISKNRATREFFDRELSTPFEGTTVVVSHHCPISEAAGDEHDGHVSAAYFNRWHSLVEKANVWIFGHTHRSIDVLFGESRLISNQRGYPGEETGFDPDKIVEITT
ncbi:metallophosphoesterase family protein [Pseudomonas syringae group genomosp. 3]|uniref:metallophosphoesterase family protein n=1 Tax=Pseudomonas syringae group genomosp. 3 TaxID=251701 RepID=UPI000EFF5D27|nr:metallophosphoesterase family protein [Pseudomonas syringae group genomosp. 3]QQN28592.1 metallophosphoesterase family protein [Pseudomonas syringae pv. maculicola]